MNAAAWICLLLPLAAAVAITLAGTRISRRARRLPLDRDDDGRVRRRDRRVRDHARRVARATARTYSTVVDVALGRASTTSASRSSPTSSA